MTRLVTAAGLVIALGIGGLGSSLLACGDKYLIPGLGTHYERSRASRQAAAVLIYAAPGSDLSKSLTRLSVDAALRKDGYRPRVVSSADEVAAAVLAAPWDVIVMDGRVGLPTLRLTGGSVPPRIVPLLTGISKADLKSARTQYGAVLANPTKARAFIDTIDDALDLHEADVRAAAKTAHR